ncbi:hypothetical protein X977_3264 [Burkholderia pseudomallei MSHR7504]|nr:hypothetical protein X977_3264 [Burkholderia pseudomallei MSHR7504]
MTLYLVRHGGRALLSSINPWWIRVLLSLWLFVGEKNV